MATGGTQNHRSSSAYFSVPFDFLVLGSPLPYDLYINSSAVPGHERFVRIFPMGDALGSEDVTRFREKYGQLYVPEEQRWAYYFALCAVQGVPPQQKAVVLKDSAIRYLDNVFTQKFSPETFGEALKGCQEVVSNFVDLVQGYSVENLQDLIGSLSFHDFYTYDHSINVSMYNILIFRLLNPSASKDDLTQAGLGGLLHDLGKVKIPTSVLNNAGKLSEEDFRIIKRHPGYGIQLLKESKVKLPAGIDLDLLARVVYEHHENFDGSGYPEGLTGDKIHVLARITSISDFFDAVTTKRSYHEPLPTDAALALMERSVGKKLDPTLFKLFEKNARRLHHVTASRSRVELPSSFDPCQPCADLRALMVPVLEAPKRSPRILGAKSHSGPVKLEETFEKLVHDDSDDSDESGEGGSSAAG